MNTKITNDKGIEWSETIRPGTVHENCNKFVTVTHFVTAEQTEINIMFHPVRASTKLNRENA